MPEPTAGQDTSFYLGSDSGFKVSLDKNNYVTWDKNLNVTRLLMDQEGTKFDLKASYKY